MRGAMAPLDDRMARMCWPGQLVQQHFPYVEASQRLAGTFRRRAGHAPDELVKASARHQVVVVEDAQDQLEKVNHHTSPIALVDGATA